VEQGGQGKKRKRKTREIMELKPADRGSIVIMGNSRSKGDIRRDD